MFGFYFQNKHSDPTGPIANRTPLTSRRAQSRNKDTLTCLLVADVRVRESLDDNLVSKLVKEGEGDERVEGIKSLEWKSEKNLSPWLE